MTDQLYPGRPSGAHFSPPGRAPQRPAALELAVGAWATDAVLYWLLAALTTGGAVIASVVFGVAVAGILVFGCWKVRSGHNGWRVFFTVLSGCYAVLVPFGFLDPAWGLGLKAFSALVGALGVTGIVCSWLPASNRYFHAAVHHRRAVQAQRFAEFMRDDPPPPGLRRRDQPPPPASGGWNGPPRSR